MGANQEAKSIFSVGSLGWAVGVPTATWRFAAVTEGSQSGDARCSWPRLAAKCCVQAAKNFVEDWNGGRVDDKWPATRCVRKGGTLSNEGNLDRKKPESWKESEKQLKPFLIFHKWQISLRVQVSLRRCRGAGTKLTPWLVTFQHVFELCTTISSKLTVMIYKIMKSIWWVKTDILCKGTLIREYYTWFVISVPWSHTQCIYVSYFWMGNTWMWI